MSEQPQTPVPERVVLHVGCGPYNPNKLHAVFRKPGWRELRLDINPEVKPDIVASMLSMPMVGDASVDAVWSSHNLEHLYAHEVPVALAEFLRVLKAGGLALITLPDLQRVAELVAADKLEDTAYMSPAGPIAPLDTIYGHRASIARGNIYMAHNTGFTAKTLGAALARAGFVRVDVKRNNFDLWAVAYKPLPAAG
jgi:predicted SAM-dependent methyltransferase